MRRKGTVAMTNNEETRTAKLYSAKAPEKADSDRFVAFLRRKYGEGVELEWVEDRTMRNGFRLEVGTHVYDWSEKGLFKQFDAYLNKLRRTETASQPVIPLLAEALKDWTPAALAEETGEVISVADGIAMVSGLENAAYGEILLFESDIRGMVLELGPQPDRLHSVRRRRPSSCRAAPSGAPAERPVCRWARTSSGASSTRWATRWTAKGGIPQRRNTVRSSPPRRASSTGSRVNEPLETGILTIDSMFPIGKGPARADHRRPPDRQDGHRGRRHPQPEGQGRRLHLRRHRPEGQFGLAAGGRPCRAGRDGIHRRRQRIGRERLRRAAIHRAVRRLRAGRIFYGQGAGRAHRIRRPLQARRRLPRAQPAAGAARRAARPIPATCSISIPDCWSAPPTCPTRAAAAA